MKRTLRHPIRGDRLHPKPATTLARRRTHLAGQHQRAAHAAAQERQRRLHRRLARGGGGPPQPPPAHRRDRRPAPLRRPGAAAVDAAGGRGEELRRRSDAQPGTRRERGRTPRRDRRPQRHGPGVQHARSRRSCCRGPRRRRTRPSSAWWRRSSARRRKQVQASINNNQYSPYEPVPVAVGVSQDTVQYLQTHQSQYPGVTRADRGAAHLSPGRDHGHAVLGYVGCHHLELPRGAPERGLHPGQPDRRLGDRGPVRAVPEGRGRAPGPLGRRQRQRGGHARAPRHPRSATRWCSTSTTGSSRRCRTTCRRRSWPTARRPTRSTAARCRRRPTAPSIVMNPQNGQVLAHGLVSRPTTSTSGWAGSRRPTSRRCSRAEPRTTTPSRASTRRARPSS